MGMPSMDSHLVSVYLCAMAFCALTYQSFTDLGLSTLLTVGAAIQCFGYTCLRVKINRQKSVAGISGRTLTLQAMSIVFRLCSTTWLMGYIPVDKTGDWLYQVLDVATLLMILQILQCVYKTHKSSYQKEHDSFNVMIVLIVCVALAAMLHPDLNNRPVFDTFWTAALYIDVVAMLPQLSMMAKIGGQVEALTSHFVGATAARCVASLVFWYYGYVELAPLDGSGNLAGYGILVAHFIQVLLLGDFFYFYIRACIRDGCHPQLEIREVIEV